MYLSGDSNMRRARLDLANFNTAVAEASFDQKSACEECSQVILRQIQRPYGLLGESTRQALRKSSRVTRGTGAAYRPNNTKLDHDFGTPKQEPNSKQPLTEVRGFPQLKLGVSGARKGL
jgi:hypothetical protein